MRTVAAVVALVACVQAGVWALARTDLSAPDVDGQLSSVSYAPFAGNVNADEGGQARAEQIRSDLAKLAPLTRSIRLYSSTGGVELVPPIAADFGIRVTVGAWIDKNADRNEREIKSAIALAKHNSNVKSVIVGNETIYRADQTVPELIKKIKRVKRATNVPVSTGEIWNVWLEHPELVSAVDYIAAHILPYWEGVSADHAANQAILIYDKLRQAYPGKRIVIAEFGWPSAGYNLKDAEPGRLKQAEVLREFVSQARAYGIEYNIVEAIDQPWKVFEGGVGPYWGMFDAARHPKFAWSGPISDPDHWRLAGLALLVSLLLSLPILAMRGLTLGQSRADGGRRQWRRRLDGRRLRLLGRPLFRAGRRLRARSRHRAAGPAGRHRAGAHPRDRHHRLRPAPAPADRRPPAAPRTKRRRRKCRSTFRPIASRRRCSS